MSRTRIKICGLTRPVDMDAAVAAGADAVGLVFYPPSPRAVAPAAAQALARRVPPFVTRVGLFVNEDPARVRSILEEVDLDLLQFHGDEDDDYCRQFGRPFVKVARVRPELDLVEFARSFPSARALLLDAYVEGYGGGGKTFDWTLIPRELPLPLILSGGLQPENVAAAVRGSRPWAVDVSSGVESAKGIKDAARIAAFVAAVKDADA
ncbi:N-(5'-phosphoribosyl)anthranilate isomerase [Denitratisoma sp. DHT3]|uniref:phosphoribosylanthranilate isomerase n=1 Tax=Denitratisoma sp. DHT3 TaxID=1981880 RepID=UPI0011989390|nr:phosphoribosylanthranilate isomerase [Denitratisoma sp. DHT3]QDX81113.1 N-(5'-phosphoribosyl)anthranilate isomerase [Denitratisoma sp. DHT3]